MTNDNPTQPEVQFGKQPEGVDPEVQFGKQPAPQGVDEDGRPVVHGGGDEDDTDDTDDSGQ